MMRSYNRWGIGNKIALWALVITTIIGTLGLIFSKNTGYSQTTKNNQNSTVVQIIGDNNNVNKIAKYNWVNYMSWKDNLRLDVRNGKEVYVLNLYFQATEGILPDERMCAHIKTDVKIKTAVFGGVNAQASSKTTNDRLETIYCSINRQRELSLTLLLENRPTKMEAYINSDSLRK